MKLFGIKITPKLVAKIAATVVPAVAAVRAEVKAAKAKKPAA